MKKISSLFGILIIALFLFSCSDNNDSLDEPMLIVKFKFDPNQVRLNNLGQPSTISSGRAAQSPVFNSISAHYLELAQNANTQLGAGTILYHAPETTLGGSTAIDFSQSKIVAEGETFLQIPLKSIAAGTYEWLRVSLSYQNFNFAIRNAGSDYQGTLAGFVGFRTYIATHAIGNNQFPVNANKSQGYWAFALNGTPYTSSGSSPANSTTVPNPLSATSPIPAGSCVVTGKFPTNFVLTGNEKKNIEITLNLSVNNSFEWTEITADGKYEPAIGENVVDMGLRGLIPTYIK